jgi:hypothetical protein
VLAPVIGALAIAVAGTGVAASVGLVPVPTPPSQLAAGASPGSPAAATHRPSTAATSTTHREPAGPTWVDLSGASGDGQVRRSAEPSVAPLTSLTPPDVVLKLDAPATPAQVDRLRKVDGVQAVAVLDKGKVTTPAGTLPAIGANPSKVRGFTPKLTASSDALWQSQARGEMALSFSLAGKLKNKLGTSLPVTGATPAEKEQLRLGAFASIGLPHSKVVVTHTRASELGLAARRLVLVAAPDDSIPELTSLANDVFGSGASADVLRPDPVDQSKISSLARSAIPADYLKLYREAATTCPGLPWEVLAAIGTVETGNGADTSTSSKGAMGPMQFLPSTFHAYGLDASGDGIADIQNPQDAIFSAAHYLCASGAGRGGESLAEAIFAYNHANWYVEEVLKIAQRYQ